MQVVLFLADETAVAVMEDARRGLANHNMTYGTSKLVTIEDEVDDPHSTIDNHRLSLGLTPTGGTDCFHTKTVVGLSPPGPCLQPLGSW